MNKLIIVFCCLLGVFFASAQSDTARSQYTGTYKFPDGSVVSQVEVTLEDTILNMSSDAGNSPLNKIGVDSFEIVRFNGTASFKRGDTRSITGVHIEAMGYILDGVKQSNNSWVFIIKKRLKFKV